jgi:hypothetical protein
MAQDGTDELNQLQACCTCRDAEIKGAKQIANLKPEPTHRNGHESKVMQQSESGPGRSRTT